MLIFDNRFCRELPGDSEGSNRVRQVEGACWSPVSATPVSAPRVLAYSREMVDVLGLKAQDITGAEWAEVLGGNALLPGMQSYATCYGGHQFGHWAGQLGDGRAIFLGEVLDARGARWEMQLKGAGPTPYSRRGDGRAVLRSSIREFLCSEAMHHLGIPTTRALSLVSSGDVVVRDMFYDGHPEAEPGAIVCRMAPSFTRFGHFELPYLRGDSRLLSQLVEFTLERDFAFLKGSLEERMQAWFSEVCERSARLVVAWMQVGFVHGVLNTDNMSILGLTIDYGPYGWVDDFDPGWTPNTTDAAGKRYCFGRQPDIVRWNLERLAEALESVNPAKGSLAAGLEVYDSTYDSEARRVFGGKFGLMQWHEDDGELISEVLGLMGRAEMDMTEFFRRLAHVNRLDPSPDFLRTASYRQESWAVVRPAFAAWLQRYVARLGQEGVPDGARELFMNRFNPRYVLRNYLAQQVIEQVEAEGDVRGLHELLDVLRNPYVEQPGKEAFSAMRPEWARHKPGCSMLSCSS